MNILLTILPLVALVIVILCLVLMIYKSTNKQEMTKTSTMFTAKVAKTSKTLLKLLTEIAIIGDGTTRQYVEILRESEIQFMKKVTKKQASLCEMVRHYSYYLGDVDYFRICIKKSYKYNDNTSEVNKYEKKIDQFETELLNLINFIIKTDECKNIIGIVACQLGYYKKQLNAKISNDKTTKKLNAFLTFVDKLNDGKSITRDEAALYGPNFLGYNFLDLFSLTELKQIAKSVNQDNALLAFSVCMDKMEYLICDNKAELYVYGKKSVIDVSDTFSDMQMLRSKNKLASFLRRKGVSYMMRRTLSDEIKKEAKKDK